MPLLGNLHFFMLCSPFSFVYYTSTSSLSSSSLSTRGKSHSEALLVGNPADTQTSNTQGHRDIQKDCLGPQAPFPAPSRNYVIDFQFNKTPAFSDPTHLGQKVLPKTLSHISGSSLQRRVMLVVAFIKNTDTAEPTNPMTLQCPYDRRKTLAETFAGSQSCDQALCTGGEGKEVSVLCQSLPKGKFIPSPSSSTVSLIQA